MAKSLLILSILFGLVSAFLGFQTKQRAEGLQTNLKDAKGQAAAAKSSLTKAQNELDETKKSLDDTKSNLTKTEEELTNSKGQLATAKSDLSKAQGELDEKSKLLASIEAELNKIKEMGFDPGKIQELGTKMKELAETKAKLETELAESKQIQETLKSRADELQAVADTKERVVQEYKQGFVRNGLSGKIVAYNPGWNFVVLNIGDKAGLKSGVQMVVLRDGSMLGKVRVTSVEPSTAIADVMPGTIARGESIQPGDSVVFEGRR